MHFERCRPLADGLSRYSRSAAESGIPSEGGTPAPISTHDVPRRIAMAVIHNTSLRFLNAVYERRPNVTAESKSNWFVSTTSQRLTAHLVSAHAGWLEFPNAMVSRSALSDGGDGTAKQREAAEERGESQSDHGDELWPNVLEADAAKRDRLSERHILSRW